MSSTSAVAPATTPRSWRKLSGAQDMSQPSRSILELAGRARSNLNYLPQVEVIEADGGAYDPGPSDGILVNAGATHPRSTWLDSLRIGGRLILPLTVANEADASYSGHILKIKRQENGLRRPLHIRTSIFPCSGARDPELNDKLSAAFKREDLKCVQSLRRDSHKPSETCWLHSDQFCLSTLPVN